VYSATHKPTGKIVAVKAFDKDKFQDLNVDKPALVKELSIMRKMDHRGVIKLFEVFENETYIFLVCEYLEGGEFFHQLKKTIHYDENLLAHAVYNILSAVEYIHSKGVLHRDIKPENIILKSKGDIKEVCLADFGLADYYNPKGDYMFKRCGTPGYVAPELLQDKLYDYKIDIFSVGVLMFIM
jgi:calcium/calmodulin-dependent protein kinase I